jgi:hypothetical protein
MRTARSHDQNEVVPIESLDVAVALPRRALAVQGLGDTRDAEVEDC